MRASALLPLGRSVTLLAALAAGLAACTREVPGEKLCREADTACAAVPALCDLSATGAGAVVVRWRIADAAVGRLLSRGQCCCNPGLESGPLAREQCADDRCLDSPAWMVRNVKLKVSRAGTPHLSCTFTARCSDGELTTPACLLPGEYDLQLTADVDGFLSPGTNLPPDRSEYQCLNRPAVTPPAVRRQVKAGQTVNLDGIVLGVNGQ
jgi:hypothetical protein